MEPVGADARAAVDEHWRCTIARCRARASNGAMTACDVAVARARERRGGGRGVFATRAFERGECVMIERALVGAQHEENVKHARACENCHRYVGTVSSAVGRRLLEKYANAAPPKPTTREDLVKLASGEATLPGADAFDGPREVGCLGACARNVYCSEACASEAWRERESLMCPGEKGMATNKRALDEFYAHARETNDIFVLAAKAVATMCARASRASARDRDDGSSGKEIERDASAAEDFARLPFAVVANAPWWESVATPHDCEDERAEMEFRTTLRTLAQDSLDLLRSAWGETANAWPRFFTLETYGRLIGAFELNNLELVVESPVENYFLAIDAAPDGEEKRAAMRVTQPLLDALDTEYDIPLLGSALFSVQSGFNHDCDPNCEPMKGEEDIDGACVIIARRDIAAGEELTISYVSDEASKSRDERNDELCDYGFVCRCERCENELREQRSRKR